MNVIPLVDLGVQHDSIKDELEAALKRVLEERRFILGPDVKALEEEVAAYLGCKYALGVGSGTDAIEVALVALGIGDGDEVITTPYTFIATAESICNVGAKPVFVDINSKTYCIDVEKIEEKITPKTKAIMPVHLFGHPAAMDQIMKLARKHKIAVVEDCAQSLGAEFNGKKVCAIGDAGCISFFPGKNLGCFGDGGMVVMNREDVFKKAKMYRNHGSERKYYHQTSGCNSRLDTIQAAVLRIKLKRLEKWNDMRNKNAELYSKLIKESSKANDIVVPWVDPKVKHSFNYYTIRIKDRDEVAAKLKAAGISSAVYYPVSLHLQEVYKDLGYKAGDFPVAESMQKEILSLPMFPELQSDQIKKVVGVLKA